MSKFINDRLSYIIAGLVIVFLISSCFFGLIAGALIAIVAVYADVVYEYEKLLKKKKKEDHLV